MKTNNRQLLRLKLLADIYPDMQRPAAKRLWRRELRDAQYTDALASKSAFKARLDSLSVNGYVVICVNSVDCDMTHASYTRLIPASLMACQCEEADIYNGAEGPTSVDYASPYDVEPNQYETNDLALEAFENGHPHVVYI